MLFYDAALPVNIDPGDRSKSCMTLNSVLLLSNHGSCQFEILLSILIKLAYSPFKVNNALRHVKINYMN